jgi:hypothetical protein
VIQNQLNFATIFALACFFTIQPVHAAAKDSPTSASPALTRTYEDWVASCRKVVPNRALRGRYPAKETLPLKDFAEFDAVLSAFTELYQTGPLRQPTNWVGRSPELDGFFDTSRSYFLPPPRGNAPIRFQPFAQKLSVPAESEVFFRGDLHGDIHSFLTDLEWLNTQKYLKGFEITRTNFYMVFLGDYTDRGMYGAEVLYTIYRLKLANPDRVFLARGNHEDISLLSRYGFLHEGRAKFGASFTTGIAKIARAYDFLPVVIYLESGANAIQCNHGGMEPGYDPRSLLEADGAVRFQLLGKLKQQEFLTKNPSWSANFTPTGRDLARRAFQDFEPQDAVSPMILGFMWNDFTVVAGQAEFALDPDRAFIFGDDATRFVLQNASSPKRILQAVFRAHQHSSQLNPMMRRLVASSGVHQHWQPRDSVALLEASPQELKKHLEQGEARPIPSGSVWTFNVSPDSSYGEGCGFTFDAFGILKPAPAFEDWRLRIVNVTNPR